MNAGLLFLLCCVRACVHNVVYGMVICWVGRCVACLGSIIQFVCVCLSFLCVEVVCLFVLYFYSLIYISLLACRPRSLQI